MSGASQQRRSQTYAVITGGGTAGHVFPALAIAEMLIEAGERADSLLYVGSRRGPETQLVPAAGLRGYWCDVRGVRRSLRPRALVASFRAVVLLTLATLSCWRLIREERPRVVISVGGYASMPAAMAAWLGDQGAGPVGAMCRRCLSAFRVAPRSAHWCTGTGGDSPCR